ncbi:unnamed protein product [Durusdinium trenchii]|uniref:Uncharacterized protein n=1 Tax=Durusdinium trenchii TaxID=1381693 RepID=A0ABP0J6W2_9DINO
MATGKSHWEGLSESSVHGQRHDRDAEQRPLVPATGAVRRSRSCDERQGEDGLHSEEFNAGLMVLEPNEATFQRLVDLAPQVRSSSGGVQPLLRAAFPDFHPLDHWRDNAAWLGARPGRAWYDCKDRETETH